MENSLRHFLDPLRCHRVDLKIARCGGTRGIERSVEVKLESAENRFADRLAFLVELAKEERPLAHDSEWFGNAGHDKVARRMTTYVARVTRKANPHHAGVGAGG